MAGCNFHDWLDKHLTVFRRDILQAHDEEIRTLQASLLKQAHGEGTQLTDQLALNSDVGASAPRADDATPHGAIRSELAVHSAESTPKAFNSSSGPAFGARSSKNVHFEANIAEETTKPFDSSVRPVFGRMSLKRLKSACMDESENVQFAAEVMDPAASRAVELASASAEKALESFDSGIGLAFGRMNSQNAHVAAEVMESVASSAVDLVPSSADKTPQLLDSGSGLTFGRSSSKSVRFAAKLQESAANSAVEMAHINSGFSAARRRATWDESPISNISRETVALEMAVTSMAMPRVDSSSFYLDTEPGSSIHHHVLLRLASFGGHVRGSHPTAAFVSVSFLLYYAAVMMSPDQITTMDLKDEEWSTIVNLLVFGARLKVVSIVCVLMGCRWHRLGLAKTSNLLSATPKKSETIFVVSMWLLAFLEACWHFHRTPLFQTCSGAWCYAVFSITAFLHLHFLAFLSVVGIVRVYTRKIRILLHEIDHSVLRGEQADEILPLYGKFQQQLLTAYGIYNRVIIPFFSLSLFRMSIFIAAFVRITVLRDRDYFLTVSDNVLVWWAGMGFVTEACILIWVIIPAARTATLHKKVEMSIVGRTSKLMRDRYGQQLLVTIALGKNHSGFKLGSNLITWSFLVKCVSCGSLIVTGIDKILGMSDAFAQIVSPSLNHTMIETT